MQLFVLLLAAVLSLSIAAQAQAPRATSQGSVAGGDAKNGKGLYLNYKCYACHGYSGQNGPGTRLVPTRMTLPAFTVVHSQSAPDAALYSQGCAGSGAGRHMGIPPDPSTVTGREGCCVAESDSCGELMEQRHLGTSGLTASAVGLGCMGMSQSYGAGDDEESVRTIHRALDLGVTYLDTADVYGQGSNEKLVGQAIRERRQEVDTRDQVRPDPEPERPRDERRWTTRADPTLVRSQPPPARRRRHRLVLPSPGRSEHPNRRHRRRDVGARSRGQGALSRSLGSRSQDHSPGAPHSPNRGAAK